MNCYVHPDISAIGTCVSCGKAVCNDCAITIKEATTEKIFCTECAATHQASRFAPCPQCGSRNASKVNYTWWGGFIGPRLLSHVQCTNCGTAYNGKSGKSNTTSIIIYYAVILGIVFACTLACVIISAISGGGS